MTRAREIYQGVYNFLIVLSVVLALAIGPIGLWKLTGSEKFLRPEYWHYDAETGTVSFRRIVTGDKVVLADWTHEIITEESGLECSASNRTSYEPFQFDMDGSLKLGPDGKPVRKFIAQFPVPAELIPCLESGEDYLHRMSWSVLWQDIIPLPRVRMVQLISDLPKETQRKLLSLERKVEELTK